MFQVQSVGEETSQGSWLDTTLDTTMEIIQDPNVPPPPPDPVLLPFVEPDPDEYIGDWSPYLNIFQPLREDVDVVSYDFYYSLKSNT